jgi:signal transduction histidine kinase
LKKRASVKQRRQRRGELPAAGAEPAAMPFFERLSGARGVRAPLEVFLSSLSDTVPFKRASFFMLSAGGELEWCANFWRSRADDEEPIGLSRKFVDWAMADQRPKVAPPGAMGDRCVYLFVPVFGLDRPLGLVILRTMLEIEALGLAAMNSSQGIAMWFGERIAYASTYLHSEAERMRLARQAALTEQLLESVGEGLLAVDGTGRLLFMNRNARLLLGLMGSTGRGVLLGTLVLPPLYDELQRVVTEAREGGHAPARQVEWPFDGAPLPLEISASAVPAPAASGSGAGTPPVLVVLRNLTAGRRLARLEEVDRLKTEFISTASHELRSPLHTIREAVKLLSEGAAGEVTPEQRKLVDIVERNADWLVRLVGDLLDMSRLEAGRIELELAPVDIGALAAEVAGRFRIEASRRGLDLRLAAAGAAVRVSADRDRIEQVLVNLVANAFKFTREGFVEVGVRPSGDTVEISVTDSGAGIEAGDLPLVFNRFEQFGRSGAERRRGTGLGLAISRRLVELHGGSISVESTPGKGSVFTVRLPRDGGASAGAGERP